MSASTSKENAAVSVFSSKLRGKRKIQRRKRQLRVLVRIFVVNPNCSHLLLVVHGPPLQIVLVVSLDVFGK